MNSMLGPSLGYYNSPEVDSLKYGRLSRLGAMGKIYSFSDFIFKIISKSLSIQILFIPILLSTCDFIDLDQALYAFFFKGA